LCLSEPPGTEVFGGLFLVLQSHNLYHTIVFNMSIFKRQIPSIFMVLFLFVTPIFSSLSAAPVIPKKPSEQKLCEVTGNKYEQKGKYNYELTIKSLKGIGAVTLVISNTNGLVLGRFPLASSEIIHDVLLNENLDRIIVTCEIQEKGISLNTSQIFTVFFPQDIDWGKQFSRTESGSASAEALGTAIDSNGNTYIVGKFTWEFKLSEEYTFNTYAPYNSDFFIAKYSPAGNLLWANHKHSGWYAGMVEANSIEIDADDNVYIAGKYNNWIQFTKDSKSRFNGTGGSDPFIVSYDADGVYRWAFGKDNGDQAFGSEAIDLAIDPITQKLSVLVSIRSFVNFGFGDWNASRKGYSFAILEFSRKGQLLAGYFNPLVPSSNILAVALAKAPNGDTYVTGNFSGTSEFVPGQIITQANSVVFLLKLNSSLVPQSIYVGKPITAGSITAKGVAVNSQNKVFVVGTFIGTATFNQQIVKSFASDMFILGFDNNLNEQLLFRETGISSAVISNIFVDSRDRLYAFGYADREPNFGNGVLNNFGGATTYILLRFDNNFAAPALLTRATATSTSFGNAVEVDASGRWVIAGKFNGNLDMGNGVMQASAGNMFIQNGRFISKGIVSSTFLYLK